MHVYCQILRIEGDDAHCNVAFDQGESFTMTVPTKSLKNMEKGDQFAAYLSCMGCLINIHPLLHERKLTPKQEAMLKQREAELEIFFLKEKK